MMRATRARYHTAIQRVRRAADQIKAQKLFEASMLGNKDLISELKKHHGGKYTPVLPENVAGANGEEEICSKFRSVYRDLYNSADTTDEMEVIKERVEVKTTADSSHEVTKITASVVKLAAVLMKKNKGDVTGSYSSDAMRNAPDIDMARYRATFDQM